MIRYRWRYWWWWWHQLSPPSLRLSDKKIERKWTNKWIYNEFTDKFLFIAIWSRKKTKLYWSITKTIALFFCFDFLLHASFAAIAMELNFDSRMQDGMNWCPHHLICSEWLSIFDFWTKWNRSELRLCFKLLAKLYFKRFFFIVPIHFERFECFHYYL